jgi:aminoglycoside 6'-N-acetyltransferase I
MIYKAEKQHIPAIAALAIQMWDENTLEGLEEDFEEIMSNGESAIFLLELDGQAAGFAQCQLRHDYVEGTESCPVGYLEGIYVKEAYRKQGHAKELLKRCEQWAKEMSCTEFASDCELDNEVSLAFHLKMGFLEANRIICFTKSIL